jgi:hypothetical protein
VPKGLSKHLLEEIEQAPVNGRCFSFTVPELFNQTEKDFLARVQDLKYHRKDPVDQHEDDDLLF